MSHDGVTLAQTAFRHGEQDNVRVPKLRRLLEHLIAAEEITLDDAIAAIAALTPAADRAIYFTSPTTASLFTLTAFARTMLDDADAGTVRATIGFDEAVDDRVNALFVAGANIVLTYDDVAGTFTVAASGLEPAIAAGTTAQYWRGDKSWQTLNAAAVAFAPAGNLASTTVQAALQELDTEKAALAGAAFTGGISGTTASFSGNVAVGKIVPNTGDLVLDGNAAGNAISLRIAGVEKMKLLGDGSGAVVTGTFSCTGNATLGDASTDAHTVNGSITISGVVSANGGGIAFPATQVPSADANTLDDYEEGTFTPELRFGGASAGLTYYERYGRYTKIGRLVFIELVVYISAVGSSTGTATIAGLPFATNASPSLLRASGSITMTAAAASVTHPVIRTFANETNLYPSNFNGGSTTFLTNADFVAGTEVYISMFYHV